MKRSRPCIWFCAAGILVLLASACSSLQASATPPGLTIEEHALTGPPTLDPLAFQPVQGSMAAITAAHSTELANTFPDESITVDGRFGLRTTLGNDTLTATLEYDQACQAGWVTL